MVKGMRGVVLVCSELSPPTLRLWIGFQCIQFATVFLEQLIPIAFDLMEVGEGEEFQEPVSISSID